MEEEDESDEDIPLRDLKRQRVKTTDGVMQAAGDAHASLVTLLSSLLKEIASHKRNAEKEKADNAANAGMIAKLNKQVT